MGGQAQQGNQFDPMRQIELTGDFFRGLGEADSKESLLLRTIKILVVLLLLVAPGGFLLFMMMVDGWKIISGQEAFSREGFLLTVLISLLSAFYSMVDLAIIRKVLKK